MMSIYEQVLGSDFRRLHPQIQRRFGLTSASGLAAVGSGTMERIWHGAFYTLPFLYMGAWRRIMFPEDGRNVPFTIENYAFLDDAGRETVTWVRTFKTRKTRRFDAYMVYNQRRGRIVDYLGSHEHLAVIVDYLGSHEHLAVDLDLTVDERGGLKLRSGAQRFYEGVVGFSFPLFFSGIADVCEWYDDADQRFHIDVNVHNRTWGPLFGYRGAFDVEWRQVEPNSLPAHLRPMRTERRE